MLRTAGLLLPEKYFVVEKHDLLVTYRLWEAMAAQSYSTSLLFRGSRENGGMVASMEDPGEYGAE